MGPLDERSVQDALVEILRQYCDVGEQPIDASTSLQKDLKLDSVGLLTLTLEAENRWQIYLGEAPDDPPQTIGEVVDLVLKRLREQRVSSE